MSKYHPVIGLEVHVELATQSKMFCGCPADHFAVSPNTQTCPVCLGLPGALPVPNKKAVEWTMMLGLALDCKVNLESKFDRKHYFYPDLPKGYQISQYDAPLCGVGKLGKIRIRRVHLEEDTGKLQHTTLNGKKVSLVDFNRSGVPLVEVVTEPDLTSALEAEKFARELQLIIRYLGISDADMEKGSMRLEANISLATSEVAKLPGYKVELKNINSFGFMKKAIGVEIKRQEEILSSGKKVTQETRGYSEETGKTFSQRTKEEEQDYRYFPEPDIPPMKYSNKQINELSNKIPELPNVKREKLKKLGLSVNYVEVLVADRSRAEYFEQALRQAQGKLAEPAKLIASVMVNQNLDQDFPEPAGLIRKLIELGKRKYVQVDEVEKVVQVVLKENGKAVQDYSKGKKEVLGFLIGQVQAGLKGQGNPRQIQEILVNSLSDDQN
ncbi:hypothetical protein A2630_00150 [Candidatus Woesebacteria bacterium RIFCSPHIGHO2_01_FULL_44_10]|uniref:Aspartyl/glutamyl-tRNA(Asn/Gln) amidotransferase subunit B n=1 Tax=Candidatus Woesebacteria bacterium RIFCSPLOWO2_01_FULL_44_14 TaxID=1802525 RepID=A0A1F8BXD3_9BACT|nr:MAG: hypothetical protein A2630_00150 [Candidatus Woesebacteria bacterium RIFCSPHIGHO2_01_FULL_44_10]OGM56280.1 MAG: hypothetical protein A3F62_03470 [Candidatus Woesebacteria bacterium RIFCSPHIGHO2_12_FULL_44_11]OGM68716.1 MAG: hypothetical protein A2975_05450 [Candidatus Woesebacteria bacterium RIFCSPLOWO2_01_FULL_44_14]